MRFRAAIALACGIAAPLAVGAISAPPSVGAETNRAALVVRFANEDVRKMCVAFDEPEITGYELLERSALPLVVDRTGLGSAICKIGAKGCSSGDCFCNYPTFWAYWVPDETGEWRFSDEGAADRTVRDGSVDGWSWGRDGKPTPPKTTFDDVCTSATKTTSRATARPLAQPSRAPASETNYLAFAGFVALFASAAAAAAFVRRRR